MNQKEQLVELAFYKMPFGKFKNVYLSDLPEAYLVWFKRKGFPAGKLGRLLESVYEMKVNGLEGVLREVRRLNP
ncbi:hypothetical protein BST97_12460 [Nonlabens spongiae]|uniref:Cytoplasmic protein n=1 Tax=Nonlabens spongiae TaxID=331648 RepID=A0A1W6MMM4_9FLAO|nr:DUF3820 family protein [Nonlabens spongiae]ARN78739.1 hypothetical protein BST97_12460 [Nonlabens spongiae]